jgi:type I restriction enzyme S subunit
LGEIPADWAIEPLADIAEIIPGNSPPSSTYNEKGEGPPFFQGNSEFGHFHPEADTWCSEPRKEAEKNDVLMSIRAPVGDLNIADKNCCIGRGLAALRPKTLNGLYLFYNLAERKPWLSRLATGSTFKSVTKSDLQLLDIPVPTIEEQRKIATVLHNIDQAIQMTDEIIEQANNVKSGVIQHVFREGVQEHESFNETKSGKVPNEWEMARFEEIIEETRYGTDTKSNTNGDGYPTLRIPNVVEKRITVDDLKYTPLSDEELDRLKLKENDILVIRTNGNPDYVGRCATFSERVEPFVFASYLIRVRVDESTVRPEYIREFLNSPRGRSEMAGWIRSSAGNYNLSVGAMEKFQVPIPSLEEQDEIVGKIEATERTIEGNRRYQSRLHRLKQGLMQDLLSGTVRTTDTNIEVPEEVAQHG